MSHPLLAASVLVIVALIGPGSASAQTSEACQLGLTSPEFEPASEDGLHALPHSTVSGHVGRHGQGLYGVDNLYLVHLGVFMGAPEGHPHNFQVVVEADLDDPAAQAQYRAHRSQSPMSLYTLMPDPLFNQTALVAGYPGRPALDGLASSSIVSGHFEQGGEPIVRNVSFDIGRVVYFREFFLGGPRLGDQNYLLFGRGGEAFGAHLLSAPPDFDQIVAIEIEAVGSPGAEVLAEITEALAGGIYLRLPERPNQENTRLRPGREVGCSLSLPSSPAPIEVMVRVVDEIYCESGEFSELVINRFNQSRRCASS